MKIAIASCSKLQQTNPQPVWSEISAEKPDILLLTGDTIYLDHDHHSNPAKLQSELRQLYENQLAEQHFAALLADMKQRGADVVAIYDDHDFLGNNRYGGDEDPALRDVARAELIRAFAPRMTGADVYSVAKLGLVDLVVLDERFYRKSPLRSLGSRDAILGERQWSWLESVVSSSVAPYLVIVSSTTIHQFGDESWEQYRGAFERLRNLIAGRAGAMVISGDVHRNALYDDSGILEVVSSGVARNGVIFGSPRQNWGVLEFSPASVRIELKGLKAGSRFSADVALNDWRF
ncbi:alkaline phosphatase D family protein [Viridibacterium curvum]|uniref:PhoD-like phosphatase metallophosphatase domain-containing protein n=1 Tax=Viridibacterium curvum TaxID=1101404 RepID=A0ABP9QSB3_9RHOO